MIHKFVFSSKFSELFLNVLLSISCLNFSIVLISLKQNFDRKTTWLVISEWIFSFILINSLSFFLSGKSETTYWISVVIASIIGGIITFINFSKTFEIKINFKKFFVKLVVISLLFPLVKIVYFSFIYQFKFYDLSFYVFIPEILVVIIWQVFHYLELDFANKSSN